MCCIISIVGRTAHTDMYLTLKSFYQYIVYENFRAHYNFMREQSIEPMNPGPILIYKNTKLLQLPLLFLDLFNSKNRKIYLPFANPI